MNLSDYMRQCKRSADFSVLLNPDEVIVYQPGVHVWENGVRVKMYAVEVKAYKFTYVTTNGNLYTQDDHGNKNKPSVFKLNFAL